ncbi:MAG: asparaginase domain-containing protein [Bacillus subtilis]|nr:asparaginase domain-containing protein [Bacillus subtilis]
MMEISQIVRTQLARDEVFGVVVVHGTDTLEETAFFLDITVDSDKPVVVTGSMKSSSELGFDGINNLVSSILVAEIAQVHGQGCPGRNERPNQRRQRSDQIQHAVARYVQVDGLRSAWHGRQQGSHFYRRVNYSKKRIPTSTFEPSVYLLKAFAGMDGDLVDFLVEQKNAKGLVLEAMGRGNIPPAMIDSVQRALSKGVPIVICSRCPSGRVPDTYGYPGGGKHLANLGCIFAPEFERAKSPHPIDAGADAIRRRQIPQKVFE